MLFEPTGSAWSGVLIMIPTRIHPFFSTILYPAGGLEIKGAGGVGLEY